MTKKKDIPFDRLSPRRRDLDASRQTLRGKRFSPRGLDPSYEIHFSVDPVLLDWLDERAAVLGISRRLLMRDVLALWANLIQDAERDAGLSTDLPDLVIPLPERYDGYIFSIVPDGIGSTHLDDAPLGIAEIER